MKRTNSLKLAGTLGLAVLIAVWATPAAVGQSADPQPAPQVTAEQQKQLDQLKQLEERLRKDRDAMHAAITEYGWDSDQTDQAREQLFQDRQEYRKLRRSLRPQGVAVPPPTGLRQRGFRARPGARNWRGRGYGWYGGPGGRGRRCCPCCRYGWW